jgi:phosphoribosylglycinamide formyltransferase 2
VNGHRRLGVLLARDVSVEKALEKVKQAYEQLEISL